MLHHLATSVDAPVLEPLRRQLRRYVAWAPYGQGQVLIEWLIGDAPTDVPSGFRPVGPLNPLGASLRPELEALRPTGPVLEEMYNLAIDRVTGGARPEEPMREARAVHGGSPRLSARGTDEAARMAGVLAGVGSDPTPWTVEVL